MITLGLSENRTIRAAGEPWAVRLRALHVVTWPAPREKGEAMKVRILSGNQAGAVVEMGEREAESSLSSGFAEMVPEVLVELSPVQFSGKAGRAIVSGVPVMLHSDQVIPSPAVTVALPTASAVRAATRALPKRLTRALAAKPTPKRKR